MAERSLPIWEIHAAILEALTRGNRLVLVAPTGSGKTTQVPQMLLEAGLGCADGRKIVVLQPRRVAARTVAARVAWERGCPLGGEVGYQIRFDDQTGLGTRICFVTEGILLRWLQDDPTLADVGTVLFDEFHERNLLSDVALALTRQMQATTRPDLKIAVMSATLEAEPVAKYLGGCPILISEGQSWPVETRFLDHHDERPIYDQAADAIERLIANGERGDVLVFMPGMGEINATIRAIGAASIREPLALLALHGDLPAEEQDQAFAPNPRRKIVVATNVAETSVTIDGIRHVIDSGLARVARYDAERGINTLTIEPISRASADQRKGRAGRTAPGTCHRLWTESGHLNRPDRNTPEIQRSDLAEVVLLLHSLGIRRAAEFDWLDRPDPQAVERAEKLLLTLGALEVIEDPVAAPRQSADENAAVSRHAATTGQVSPASKDSEPGRDAFHRVPISGVEIRDAVECVPTASSGMVVRSETPPTKLTAIGRRMLRLPMHPRYSRMLVEASKHGCVPSAALCAALVSGRDLLMRLGRDDGHIAEARELFEASALSDFFTLMRAFRFAKNCGFNPERCRRYGIHAQTARQVDQTFEQILEIAQRERLVERPDSKSEGDATPAASGENKATAISDEPILRCLLAGFVDQLCLRRDAGTLECDLTEGRSGTLMRESMVRDAKLFVAATMREVSGRESTPRTLLGLATAVKREWVEEMFPAQITTRVEHLFDRTHKRVAAIKVVRFRDLVIHHEHQREVDPEASGRCLAEAYRKGWFELPLFDHRLKQFVARVNLICEKLPDLEFPPLDARGLVSCLTRAFRGLTTVKEAQATHLREAFEQHLAKERCAWLDELLPLTVAWPDGRQLKLLYTDGSEEDDTEPGAELTVKLHECFALKEHPRLGEGRIPVKLWLSAPDGKRLDSTFDWPAWRANQYQKLRRTLQQKFPGNTWL